MFLGEQFGERDVDGEGDNGNTEGIRNNVGKDPHGRQGGSWDTAGTQQNIRSLENIIYVHMCRHTMYSAKDLCVDSRFYTAHLQIPNVYQL